MFQESRLLRDRLRVEEIKILKESLELNCGNVAATAKDLGVTRQAMYRKMHRFGISHYAEECRS